MNERNYDLVLVGSSFASTFFLKEYLKKAPASAKILVLERGHLYSHRDRLLEIRGQKTSNVNRNEDHTDTYINNTPDKDWTFQLGLGGSSNCWHGCVPRFLPSDFKMKSRFGIARDWPIDYDELDPFYEEVEELMNLSGPADLPYPKSKPYPQPPHIFSTVDRILHEKYGNLYINPPAARATVPVDGRGACCGNAVCSLCPVNAKYTIENGMRALFQDPRITMVHGAHVYSMDMNFDRVKKINYFLEGKEHSVSAEVFGLGANAIFNSHILLNSGDKNPYTGKGLGTQISFDAIIDLENLDCVGGSTKVNANAYMLYDGDHRKEFSACLMEADNSPYVRYERGKWRHQARFRMMYEDLPDDDSLVSTTDDILKPQVNFKGFTDYALRGVANTKKVLPELFSCLPIEKIEYSNLYSSKSHMLGTTRMSASAADGVVDKTSIHHQYRNLFVLGSGSFTTYTPTNPTLTLSALSMYAANKSF